MTRSPVGSAELTAVLEEARRLGYLGPGAIGAQLAHARGFVVALEASGLRPGARVLDLGSGGGVPGLVIVADGRYRVTLLDGKVSRGRWLVEACERITGHEPVGPDPSHDAQGESGIEDEAGIEGDFAVDPSEHQVVVEQAEVAAHDPLLRGRFDAVVARGFGPPSVVAECAAGFLVPGGVLLVSEPPPEIEGAYEPETREADRWAGLDAAGFGLRFECVTEHDGFGFSRCRQVEAAPGHVPRKSAAVRKRPRF